ncbi:MAG: energy-coupling factor transporter transmembrane protein EcfT [Treponema sp.]|jgi:energy-coupling factor transport system permease protein|nr:energy-coupling factor transporter transmembrane protein EcfT [Treponema sp.]
MAFSGDFYIRRDSWLHRLDPRVKLVLTAALAAIALRINTLFPALAMLGGIHLLLISARIPRAKFLWVWTLLLPVTIMILIFWPLFNREGRVLFSFGILRITLEALMEGAAMSLRICIMGFACFVLLFSTDQAKIVRALVKLGIPYRIGLMLAIALRYLPTFFGIITMVTEAQKSRGLDLDRGPLIKKLKAYMPILAAVLISGIKTSDNLSKALETRAFSAPARKRTCYSDIAMRPGDFVFLGITLAATVFLLVFFHK